MSAEAARVPEPTTRSAAAPAETGGARLKSAPGGGSPGRSLPLWTVAGLPGGGLLTEPEGPDECRADQAAAPLAGLGPGPGTPPLAGSAATPPGQLSQAALSTPLGSPQAGPSGTAPPLPSPGNVPASVRVAVAEPARPLGEDVRRWAEHRVGRDLSEVRVHTGLAATRSARELEAEAYTLGSHIVLDDASAQPGTGRHRDVLAHELGHVLAPPTHALIGRSPAFAAPTAVPSSPGDDFARDPANPKNVLTAREMFSLWRKYWARRQNRAVEREAEIRDSLRRKDDVQFAERMDLFEHGRRDALGADYETAANELGFCQAMTLRDEEVLNWLEDINTPVTFEQVNRKAVELTKAFVLFETYVAPLILAGLGAVSSPAAEPWSGAGRSPTPPRLPPVAEPPPVSPPPVRGGSFGRVLRNLTARAMIGLAEGEPVTRPPGSSPAIEERQPAATVPVRTSPPVAPRPAGPTVTAPSPQAPVSGTSAPTATPGSAAEALRDLGRADDAALESIWDLRLPAVTIAPGQGVVTVAPEVTAGVTPAQRQVLARILGQPFTSPAVGVLAVDWNAVARAGDAAILGVGNSRYLFGLHRNRFWRLVAASPMSAALLRSAGFIVDGGAPYFFLNGQRVTLTIDHITERQSAPQLALTASNLRLSLSRENSVVLRLLHDLSPFQ